MVNELSVLLSAMRAAGNIILDLQSKKIAITTKKNNELVTEADLKINQLLQEKLLLVFRNDAWLSEESIDDYARITAKRTWIVDPIDGTKEFAQGIPEYAISVALVEKHQPIMSSVFNPATNELFYAVKGKGAWLNDGRIYCQQTQTNKLSLLASRSEFERGEWEKFKNHDVKIMGSIAYKLALIARGDAHATFSLGAKNEWDVAAGVLLVTEAGGKVANKYGAPLQFNQTNLTVNGIVATTSHVYAKIFDLIKDSVF